ncbi:MAG: bifunctional phosphoribosyl-AMP cyclohydrolase/phosphoribosyl-ATP diphosphatase HisIE [Cyclobacteriaceae bacterium]|nr:bifunctional phosphoribosyl-AMP cyclohydrolase/phosphoribosyl-ATP diphosphatase HisIE [Cyclobacteriaceae bacterium]
MTPQIDFNKMGGLVPCIVQDADTDKVLMLAFMNAEALQITLRDKRATFFSRSRQKLWTKGETSGNYLEVVDLIVDCDQDTLLLKAKPHGPVCHTGKDTCFGEVNTVQGLGFLETIILQRKSNPKEGSYTNKLLNGGINAVAQKVGEEAVELVIEAKDNHRDKFLNEAADLMYHYLVLLAAKDVKLEEVSAVLRDRHKQG